ncbi:ciliogenesis and planar polarity effector 1 [Stegostoma tigrinum]|uniref:ciliogenesis and planar polarity effector 1 n=1 Tax=Stegostoma tigrinum TaxID=3053191 RepID=UPI00286FB0BD|nr:ciliogenesis and planar polarity effector 1 [Stegostoma tigrinum]
MNLKLEVLLSTSIKHQKPWPRLDWIGEEKEAILLSADQRLSILTLATGRTHRRIPKLQHLLKNMLSVTTSANGAWLLGLLSSGQLFLWKKDADCLKTVATVASVSTVAAAARESASKPFLFVSRNGKRVLVASQAGTVFLWESTEERDLSSIPETQLSGSWAQVMVDEKVKLPQADDKESTVHAVFHTDEGLGDCCFCSFVFTCGEVLVLTTLRMKWFEQVEKCTSAIPFCAQWVTQTHSLGALSPVCTGVKSRGALLAAFSGDGLVLAVIINQNDPKATQVLFVNPLNDVMVSSSLRGCGSKGQPVPVKFLRSYWVGAVSWTHDDLFLACMLKRGALLLLSRLGELLSITTFGCSVEFGPAEYIPLHPLITYRPPLSSLLSIERTGTDSSPTSEDDPVSQWFSVAAHPRLPYLIVSDGYMFTLMRFAANYSASSVLKTVLLEVTQDLNDVRHSLMNSEHKYVNYCLQPMSSLKGSFLQEWEMQGPGSWMSPSFLQDETAACGQVDEDDDSDDDAPCLPDYSRFQDCNPNAMEQGHLEFASMFDTLHAKQAGQEDHLEAKFRQMQNNLLAAWSMLVSVKEIEGSDQLLQYTVQALLQFACLLPFAPATLPSSSLKGRNKLVKKVLKKSPGIYRTFQLLQYCLTVLCWDWVHKQSLPHAVRLTADIVKLMLSQKLGSTSISHSLLGSLMVLKLTSIHLDAVYSVHPQEFMGLTWSIVSDSLQASVYPKEKCSRLTIVELPSQTVQTSQRPSHRLAIAWRLLYQHALQHHFQIQKPQQQLKRENRKRLQMEEAVITALLSQIQATFQTMGERLGQNRQLMSLAGERNFLLGSYQEAIQIWRTALQEEMGRDGRRVSYLQTRYSLAILYTHLYLYNLRAAQHFCEHLVRRVVNQDQSEISEGTFGLAPNGLMVLDVGLDAALAVIQSLARFMALYFSNQPVFVLPPHHVDTLPPLHYKTGCLPRVVFLQRCRVSLAVREQYLSSTWSVKYTVELMLLSRLFPEAVWFALSLGDWKSSVVLGQAFSLHCQNLPDPSRRNWTILHLPADLQPSQIFRDKLQTLLGCPGNRMVSLDSCMMAPGRDSKPSTDSFEEVGTDALFLSVQEILKAAVMVNADVLSETFQLLMQTAKEHGSSLPGLVPDGLYLPAPPLYCPQPAIDTESIAQDSGLYAEKAARHKLSDIIQRQLLLFRAARCSLPAAHWYINKLRRAQKVMNKIRGKAGIPPLSPFPDSLLRYGKARSSFFRPGAGGDATSSAVSSRVISSFRDLCGLCWMFHVRERLSESCRKYQKARDSTRSCQDDPYATTGTAPAELLMGRRLHTRLSRIFPGTGKGETASGTPVLNPGFHQSYEVTTDYDAAVLDHCLNSLDWACRMLPFARFMNVEELVQDIILSLVSELPPIRKVAEILVRAFPDVEDIRVPLRDKYHSLQHHLRHSTVQGLDGDEMMSVLLHELHGQRMKVMKRAVQTIGPTEQHIWERTDEGLGDQEDQTYDRFSLGTSLSRSSLTDTRRSQNGGDGNTTDNISEDLQDLGEHQDRIQQLLGTGDRNPASGLHKSSVNRSYGPGYRKPAQSGKDEMHTACLPLVGSWEFERDDEEYVKFLELFLSYLLERDWIVNEGRAVPLLSSCSAFLKEQELNSLAFQVHTTLKRRQVKSRAAGQVSTTKNCSPLMSVLHQNKNLSCGGGSKPTHPSPTQGVLHSTGYPEVVSNESIIHSYFPAASTQGRASGRGLFGLKLHSLPNQLNVFQRREAVPRSTCSTEVPGTADHTHCSSLSALLEEDLTPDLEIKFQATAKLLEWMIQWSERRLLGGPHKVEKLLDSNTNIRVKTSIPVILRSLWLLDRDLGAKAQDNCNHKNMESQAIEQPRLKLVRDTSMDTGYPASLGTPVIGLEADMKEHVGSFVHVTDRSEFAEDFLVQDLNHSNHNHQQELTSDSDSGMEHDAAGGQENCTLKHGNEGEGLTQAHVNINEEEDEDNGNTDQRAYTPFSPCISISIKPKPKTSTRDKIGHSLDMETPQEEPIIKQLGEQAEQLKGEEAVREQTEVLTGDCSVSQITSQHAMPDADSSGLLSLQAASSQLQPVLNCYCVPTPPAPVSVPAATQTECPDGQTVNMSNLCRQMLQDEMSKLVQLQQINFMSLMQVVGSSMTNLPNLQQQLPSIPSHNQAPSTPTPNTKSAATSQVPPLGERESQKTVMKNSLPQDKLTQTVTQKPEAVLLHPQEGDVPSQPVITASQSVPLRSYSSVRTPLLLPPRAQPPETVFQFSAGLHSATSLPLLHLHPRYELRAPPPSCNKKPGSIPFPQPTRRVAWAPSTEPTHQSQTGFPAHLNSSAYDSGAVQKAMEDEKRKEELFRRGPPKHLNLDQYQQPAASHQNESPATLPCHCAEKSQRSLQPPSSHTDRSPIFGLPLLHLPQPLFPLATQRLKAEAESGQKWISSASSVPYPRRQQQLHSFCPETPVSMIHPPRLIPAQDIIAFEQRQLCRSQQLTRQQQAGAFFLLKGSIEPFESRTSYDSKKRLKRRRERRIAEKTISKSTQSSQCLSCPQPPEIPKVENRVCADPSDSQSALDTSGGFGLPLGSCDVRLEDQLCPLATSAGLHCFASTRKNAKERQDASTTTEQDSEAQLQPPPAAKSYKDAGILTCCETGNDQPVTVTAAAKSYKDAGILTCSETGNDQPVTAAAVQTTAVSPPPVQVVPPDVFMNLRFINEMCQKPLFIPTSHETPDQALSGHKFLNVIDIDAGELLNNLPGSASVTELPPSSDKVEVSVPQLHLTAASVTNAVPPAVCQQHGSRSVSPIQPQSEDQSQQLVEDDLTQRLLQQESINVWIPPQTSAHAVGTRQTQAQLSEMAHQLNALQDMAEDMEQDFANTKMLINTIEHLHSAMKPEEQVEYSRTCNLSALDAGAVLQKDKSQERCVRAAVGSRMSADWQCLSPRSGTDDRAQEQCYPKTQTSARSSISPDRHQHTPPLAVKDLHLSPDRNQLSRETASSRDDQLHLSGLSGVSDIVADLLNEGKLSMKGLGLSQQQIEKLSSRYSKPPKRSVQEQKEIQEWMKHKRQQRFATYRQYREDLKSKEQSPYHAKDKQKKVTNKEIKEHQKQTAVKKRVTLAVNHEQRTQAALSLMNEMLCDTIQLPATHPRAPRERPLKSARSTPSQPSSTQRGRCAASRSLSASRAERSFSRTYSMATQCRSVSASPGRGGPSGALRPTAQRRPCSGTRPTDCGVSKHKHDRPDCRRFSLRPSFQTSHSAEDESNSDTDSLTHWNTPEQIRHILDRKDDPFLQVADLAKADSSESAALSDSTSSILNNLDWNAVNKMLASVEQS